MALGRSIRIYLDGGEVSGVRHAELVNWTGQALLCPRSRIAELASWTHVVQRPGIYFLLGAEHQGTPRVYIGESEDVLWRLKQQMAQEFWLEAIVFSSKDENLTKSHVKYLESRLVTTAKNAGRYELQNGNQPTLSDLPRADRDAMEEFLLNMPLLLGVLGHRVLDAVGTATTLVGAGEANRLSKTYTFTIKEVLATGASTDEGFVIFKGSTALPGMSASCTPGWVAYKQELLASGKLTTSGSNLRFAEDVLFNSPSAAASTVSGNTVSGPAAWRAADGRSLKEVEQAAAAALPGKSAP